MKTCTIQCDAKPLARNVRIADSFFARFRGLQFKRSMAADEGVLIRPCNQIHSFNMRFSIDVLYLSQEGTILWMDQMFAPRRIGKKVKNAVQILELLGGSIQRCGIQLGDTLTIEQTDKP